MMTINVTPSNLLLPDYTSKADIKWIIDDIKEEWEEVIEAFAKYEADPKPKNKELLAEELMDLMTAAGTCLVGLSRTENTPEHFVDAIVTKVHCKDFARRYNDDDMIF